MMKSVSGKVTSVKPISLSKSAKILSNFINVENGASQSVSLYLKRTSAAFDELLQFHKNLQNPQSQLTTPNNHPTKSKEHKSAKTDKKQRKENRSTEKKKKRKNREVYDGEDQTGGTKTKKMKI